MTDKARLEKAEELLKECSHACNMIRRTQYLDAAGNRCTTYDLASKLDAYFREVTNEDQSTR
jgi:hypothetical protein